MELIKEDLGLKLVVTCSLFGIGWGLANAYLVSYYIKGSGFRP
jgi:hypothetical protein